MSISCRRRFQNSPPTISRSSTPPIAQIEALKSTVASLQKTVDDLQAAQKKAAEEQKKAAHAGQGCAGGEGGREVRGANVCVMASTTLA